MSDKKLQTFVLRIKHPEHEGNKLAGRIIDEVFNPLIEKKLLIEEYYQSGSGNFSGDYRFESFSRKTAMIYLREILKDNFDKFYNGIISIEADDMRDVRWHKRNGYY